MSRQRPSGDGSNSKRFAAIKDSTGKNLKVPVVKDVGTFLFLSDDGITWPERPDTVLLDGAYELQQDVYIEIEEGAPGAGMGRVTGAKISHVRVRVVIDSTGRYSKFSQLKRFVYAVRTPNIEEMRQLSPEEVDG